MPERETTTVIGPNARIKGELNFEGGARILGAVEGQIVGEGELTIGAGATCQASIEADTVLIDGCVEGDVVARQRLTLSAKAILRGDITAAAVAVAEGATFIGHCRVGPEALAQATTKTAPTVEPKARSRANAPEWAGEKKATADWTPAPEVTTEGAKPSWMAGLKGTN